MTPGLAYQNQIEHLLDMGEEEMSTEQSNREEIIEMAVSFALSYGETELAEKFKAIASPVAQPQRKKFELTPEMKAAIEEANKTGALHALLPNGDVMFINRGEKPEDTADLDCPYCGGSGHKDDVKPVAQPQDEREALEILDNLIASIEKHGNYSKESTLAFLAQLRQCIDAPAARDTPSQDAVDAAKLTDLQQAALALYQGPFTYERGYIFDAKRNMFADDGDVDAMARLRGWGRISYLKEPEKLQDTVGELLAALLTKHWSAATPAQDKQASPEELLDIARKTGLRTHMHGVDATHAKQMLADFVAALPAGSQDAVDAVDTKRLELLAKSDWYVGPSGFYCDEGGGMNDYDDKNKGGIEALRNAIDAMQAQGANNG